MRAVVRVVLLDAEATAAPVAAGDLGMLREPVVRYASLLRQLGANSADGFIAKSALSSTLLDAVQTVLAGQIWVSPQQRESLLRPASGRPPSAASRPARTRAFASMPRRAG